MHFAAFWSRCKISACEVRACAESKISSDTAVLTFTFHFLSSPLFSLFLPHFFSLAGHLVGFILVGRVFRKAFRILGLGERKGRWAMEQDFRGDFQVNVTWFFASFSGVLDWIVLILVWFERSLHSAQVSEESCPWPLKLMTSQRVERTWIRTGGYGRFRGEWVKECTVYSNTWQSRSNSEKPVTVVLWQFSSPKWKIDHTNGIYVPYSFQNAVWDFFAF